MDINKEELAKIIDEVVKALDDNVCERKSQSEGDYGVFQSMNQAIAAAEKAQTELQANFSVQEREELIKAMREEIRKHVDKIAKMTVEETGMGRPEDKVIKNNLAIDKTPGTENLRTEAYSGRDGLSILEEAPFGVICSITPSTNPGPTVINNGISMIASCNSVVFNPHPSAKKVSLYVMKQLNKAIINAGGPANLMTAVEEPTLQTVESCMKDERVSMLVVTGGHGVVNAALRSGKKAIGAGAGNPPCLVDDTVDFAKAASDIVKGASIDNNVLCTSEKVVVALDSIADQLIDCMVAENAQLVDNPEAIVNIVINEDGTVNKEYIGKDAAYILESAGIKPKNKDVRLAIIDVDIDHPLVRQEQLMPVMPLVRAKDFEEAMEMGVKIENKNRHSAIIHSKNVDHLTAFAKKIGTTIYVKNAPSYAGLGAGGEGFSSFTIAGPTGEGITSARTFTRKRRCILVDGFSII
ncbi:aldehyde dehydrogenase EutE [Halanaerobium sp. Z-7514]|uniref:Aldehyde dehydrogenase EutE n=1 Tax=Halanaerobium polyolivorans TaxID=2886943 RepID=A0AAW4WXR1_9FIRM|nr:aldehyde dehydrogenase family protein [Halanaerobium polyolivorans]MCC3144152.1 aldehyde dehydrogenase EutE [Halanaerobium polyolivorans]RQD74972.1 MAG: aldehyde dehydrogenase EutE [Halanaerobium sp. MSAO_Bac5]